ncbi:MAG: flagellar hook-associated protein FlgK [Austwickia sp.]|jgi:flagellar hook-associated protein 1 FlgK|nr:flagellar hook-associated protein FlgK [Austwickia sp.]MBK8436469.1 flagellar hook-associated protein FlgK [Austwickia sp.]MBK9102146.1 flagellar hook-associated protein FlgK [Austwickia sp.]
MSSFSSLNVGSLAIHAAQRGLDTTGQNISNTATPGYSRQRVDQVAIGGPTVPAIWSRYDEAGGGVKVVGVSRVRDEFLEARARVAHSGLAETEKLEQAFAGIERTFGEPSSTGLQSRLAEFWNASAKISNDPHAEAPRNLTFERAIAVTNHLNSMANQLTTQWADTVTEVRANVNDVNVMAKDVANLNRAIRNNTISGLPSNELADQRDLLVEKISTLTGATTERVADGQVSVKIGNAYLVSGVENSAVKLVATGADPRVSTLSVQWAAAGDPEAATATAEFFNTGAVSIATTSTSGGSIGEISGQLKTANEVVPGYLSKLDSVAMKFMTTVNGQQTSYTDPISGVTSQPFTADGTPGAALLSGTNASTLQVITGKAPKDLAISKGNPVGVPPALDGNNALAMSRHLADATGADATYRGLVVELGVESQSVTRTGQAQTVVARDADDARENVSGVSLNEEMTNLIKYQHSFSAAAKFITAVDATIESLLNMVR